MSSPCNGCLRLLLCIELSIFLDLLTHSRALMEIWRAALKNRNTSNVSKILYNLPSSSYWFKSPFICQVTDNFTMEWKEKKFHFHLLHFEDIVIHMHLFDASTLRCVIIPEKTWLTCVATLSRGASVYYWLLNRTRHCKVLIFKLRMCVVASAHRVLQQ